MAASPELHALIDRLSDHGLRVGQMFYNIACDIAGQGHDLFFTDDDEMTNRLLNYLKNYGELQPPEENKSVDLVDLIDVTFDSMPPELKARMAMVMKQVEQERQERSSVLTAIAEAFDIVVNLRSCGGGGPNLTAIELETAANAAAKWMIRYNAINVVNRLEALIDRRE